MSNRDKTGPLGNGPMTGRRAGPCATESDTVPFGRGVGRGKGCGKGFGAGFGNGRGFGRFCRRGSGWTTPQEMSVQGKSAEKQNLDFLREEKERIEKAIKDIEQKNKNNENEAE